MVEVDTRAAIKKQMRKLNKRILKLRESESVIMSVVYGGNDSHARILWEIRDSIATLDILIANLDVELVRYI